MNRPALILILGLLLCSCGCSEEKKKIDGDPCEANSDCASTVCHRGLCATGAPAGIGESCQRDAQCKSFLCVTGQCGWGSLTAGMPCRFSEECSSRWCLGSKCKAGDKLDGGLLDSAPDGPGRDSAPPDQAPLDQVRVDQAPPDQTPLDQASPDQMPLDQMPPDQMPPDLLAPDLFPPGGCIPKTTRPCYSGSTGCTNSGSSYSCKGKCGAGSQLCQANYSWATTCTGETLPKTEICDTYDQDCDGTADNGVCYSVWSGVTLKSVMNVLDLEIQGSVILAAGKLKSGGGAVQRSGDGGKTWFVEMTASSPIQQIEMDGLNAVAVDGNRTLHYSVDGGKNWTMGAKCSSLSTFFNLALSGKTVITGGLGVVYRSDDLGKTVTSQTVLIGGGKVLLADVAIANVSGSPLAMMAGYTYDANVTRAVYLSTDLGKKWTAAPGFPAGKGQLFRLVLAADGKAFISGYQVLFRSPDKGATWYSTSATWFTGLSLGYEAPGTVLAGWEGSGYGGMAISIDGGKTISTISSTVVKYGKGCNAVVFDGKGWVYTGNGYGGVGTLLKSRW